MAWLKAPLGAPSLPAAEVLAFCYTAFQPSTELLRKFLIEVDKLQEEGKFTERDHQLLRSSTLVDDEPMRLTLGNEEALTEQAITETLRNVTNEINREQHEKLTAEQLAHKQTQKELNSEKENRNKVQERLFWRCHRKANFCAWFVSILLAIFLVAGLASGLNLWWDNLILGPVFTVGFGIMVLMTLGNLVFGTTVMGLHQRVQNFCLARLIKYEAAATGLELMKLK